MITQHASHRMQQRGIPPVVVEWLLQFGRTRHDHHGGVIYDFDKRARRKLEQVVGSKQVAMYSDYLDSYVVTTASGDRVVTVGHRRKRFNLP